MRQDDTPDRKTPDLDGSLDALLKLAFVEEALTSDASETAPDVAPAADSAEFGHFRILRELGRGGMGVVYLAEDLRLHRNVAIKVLTAFAAHSPELRRRLLREAEAASRLDHPTICNVHEVGESNGQPFIAMQYVEGETLARKIAVRRAETQSSSVPESSSSTAPRREEVQGAIRLVETVARALHAAHESGLVHRDIKPANIMVTAAGAPVLLDFGLARDVEVDGATLTETGQVMGTPGYMAPEQLRGDRKRLDRRVDVYALGVTLYEFLTLQRPFHAATRDQLYARIFDSDPPDPRRVNPAISRDLRVVLDTALEKDPDRRYQTAEAFADDLRCVREQRPIHARPVSPVGKLVRWARRRPAWAALMVVLTIGLPLLAGLGGYLISQMPAIEESRARARMAEIESDLITGYSKLCERGSETEAIAAFDRVLQAMPESLEAIGGKARALLRQREYAACLAFLDHNRQGRTGSSDLDWFRVDALHLLDRGEEADRLAKAIPEAKSPIGHFLHGSRLMRRCSQRATSKKVFREAISSLLRAILQSERPRELYLIEFAHAAYHLADPDWSERAFEALVTHFPGSHRAWSWAGLAVARADPEKGIAANKRSIELHPTYPTYHRRLAAALLNAGKHEQAATVAQKAILLNDRDANAHVVLAMTLQRLDRIQEAEAAYARAIQTSPDSIPARFNLGSLLLARRRCKEAIPHLTRATALDPDFALAHSELGRALNSLGRHNEAMAASKTALKIDADCAEAHNSLGMIHCDVISRRDLPKAIQHFKRACELKPNATFWCNLGNAYKKAGRLSDAESAYRSALELEENHPQAWSGLASIASRRGKLDDAITHYRKALDLDDEDSVAHCNLGLVFLRAKKPRQAIHHLRRATQLRPNLAIAHSGLGSSYLMLEKLDQACSAYERAIEVNPKVANFHYNLGLALFRKRSIRAAASKFRDATALTQRHAAAWSMLGKARFFLREFAGAVTAFEQSIRIDRQAFSPYQAYGSSLEQIGRIGDAVRALRVAVQRAPETASNRGDLGRLLWQQGSFQEAVKHLRQATAHDPNNVAIRFNLGMALAFAGEAKSAVDVFEALAEHNCRIPGLDWNLGTAYLRVGKFDQAIEFLRRGRGLLSPEIANLTINHCEELGRLAPKLDSVLSGERRPVGPGEQRCFAEIAAASGRLGTAAELFIDAMEKDPTIGRARDPFFHQSFRFTGACNLARAGCGIGQDRGSFSGADRTRWRSKALEYLREELDDLVARIDDEGFPDDELKSSFDCLDCGWLKTAMLTCVRTTQSIKKLPEGERQAWTSLWERVVQSRRRLE